MVSKSEQERAAIWRTKISKANKAFEDWSKRFECKTLDDYYEGKQWSGMTPVLSKPYILNLFYSTFEIKLPTLSFKRPIYSLEPQPQAMDEAPEMAWKYCKLNEDLLNTIALREDTTRLGHSLEQALLDSGSYFGIVEVGFDARWAINPSVKKPTQKADYQEVSEDSLDKSMEPPEIPENEWAFVKRIPAHRFRTSTNDAELLTDTDWCGYYEYIRLADLKDRSEGFKNVNELFSPTGTGVTDGQFQSDTGGIDKNYDGDSEYIKIWKIWDNRARVFFMLPDQHNFILYEEDFQRLPLIDLRFTKRRVGWYPIPWFYNWKSAQDEYNETREQIRAARRRAKRAYVWDKNQVDSDEAEKLINGPDLALIERKSPGAVPAFDPVPPIPMDTAVGQSLQLSKDDFNIISGTSAEARGAADDITATQANITDARARTREAREREIVADFLCRIGKELLFQIRENATLPMYIKTQADFSAFGAEANQIASKFQLIQPEELGDHDFKVTIHVESQSPMVSQVEKQKFVEFVAMLQQFPLIAMNPDLIRELAARTGYKNEKPIQAFQQMAMLQLVGQMAQLQGMNIGQGNLGQQTTEQMAPPEMGQIENQLAMQGLPKQGAA